MSRSVHFPASSRSGPLAVVLAAALTGASGLTGCASLSGWGPSDGTSGGDAVASAAPVLVRQAADRQANEPAQRSRFGWAQAPEAAPSPAPSTAPSPAPAPSAVPPTDAKAWWQALGDATLNGLIDEAQRAAPDLATARLRLREARARRAVTAAGSAPGLSVGGSAARSRTAGGSTRNSFDVGFDASWEADVFGRLSAATAGADADVATAEANVDDVRLSLAAEVARQYVLMRQAGQRLAVARAAAARQADTLQITRWRVMAGLASEVDPLQAEATLAQTEAQLGALAASGVQAQAQLALLLGRLPGELAGRPGMAVVAPEVAGMGIAPTPPIATPDANRSGAPMADARDASPPMPALPVGWAARWPADVLRDRPDVRAAESAWRAERARTAQADAARFPRLNLSGSIGLQALTLGALGQGGYASVLAGLTAPLFDGGALRAQLDAQTAARDRAALAYAAAMRTALAEVEQALASLAASRVQGAALDRSVDAARRAAELARLRWRSGLVDFRTVLDAERSRLSAEDSRLTAQGTALSAWIALHKALGAAAPLAVQPAASVGAAGSMQPIDSVGPLARSPSPVGDETSRWPSPEWPTTPQSHQTHQPGVASAPAAASAAAASTVRSSLVAPAALTAPPAFTTLRAPAP